MAAPAPRGLWMRAWRNFLRSITKDSLSISQQGGGKFIGKDYIGNKYYEKPAVPSLGQKLPKRYFEVDRPEDYHKENLPAEWDSWLRNRRLEPPTEEEVAENLRIAEMKLRNAGLLALKRKAEMGPEELAEGGTEKDSKKFPTYEEYEVFPGQWKDK